MVLNNYRAEFAHSAKIIIEYLQTTSYILQLISHVKKEKINIGRKK